MRPAIEAGFMQSAEAGDGVYFDASTPHAYRCAGNTPAVALIVTMHQQHVPQPAMNLRPLGAPVGGRPVASTGTGAAAPPLRPQERGGMVQPRSILENPGTRRI